MRDPERASSACWRMLGYACVLILNICPAAASAGGSRMADPCTQEGTHFQGLTDG